jgi:hypothetical protein
MICDDLGEFPASAVYFGTMLPLISRKSDFTRLRLEAIGYKLPW